MALSSEQKKVARNIIRIGRRRGESAKEIKAAIETGLVEANLTNPGHGDRNSVGWRQERSHYGSKANRMNLSRSINRFFDETSKVEGQYKSAGALAQAVQRSAFPAKYNQRAGEAQQIIRSLDKGGGGSTAGVSGGSSSLTIPGVDRSDQRKKILAQYLLAQQGQSMEEPEDDPYGLEQQGALINTLVALKQAQDTPGKSMRVDKGGSSGSGRKLTPGGSFAGSKRPASQLANIGKRNGLQVVSRKRGTRNTASGGVSDHFAGNKTAFAYDLSNGSAPTPEMDRAAAQIAHTLGAKGYRKGQKLELTVVKGGYRYQVLYRTDTGGNHHNHIHVGVRKV